jgi:hypothetical protein
MPETRAGGQTTGAVTAWGNGRYAKAFGPRAPEATYVAHGYAEQLFDTGEVGLNYAVAGDAANPVVGATIPRSRRRQRAVVGRPGQLVAVRVRKTGPGHRGLL